MPVAGSFQRLPEFGILDRLLVGGLPAVFLPAEDPLGDTILHIGAVGVEIDFAGALQRVQRFDRRHQFHAIVGRLGLAA